MRKRKYVCLDDTCYNDEDAALADVETTEFTPSSSAAYGGYNNEPTADLYESEGIPIPQCHNIVSTSQIVTSQPSINLQRLADLFPFTTYDRKRFAAITIRLANPHCTCLLFGSGKLVITGSTSFSACIVASHEITRILRQASPRDRFEVASCQIQNLVAHVSLPAGTLIDLNALYERFNEQSTYQRSIFPGLVLRPPRSPIVLLVFTSGRIVCTGGRSYADIYYGFRNIFPMLKPYIQTPQAA
jgi:transcription initiation factor TFIID TATA-box-binding protein